MNTSPSDTDGVPPTIWSRSQQALDMMGETLVSKSADYAAHGEFSAFELAAKVSGSDAQTVMLAQIGIKLARIQSLLSRDISPLNESLYDSIKDLHGYAAILHGYALELGLDK